MSVRIAATHRNQKSVRYLHISTNQIGKYE